MHRGDLYEPVCSVSLFLFSLLLFCMPGVRSLKTARTHIHSLSYIAQALAAYGEYPPNSQKYYGVPLQGDVQMLVYRKDLFEAHNQTLPVDIESMLVTAEYFASALPDRIGFTSFWCGDEDS